ISSLRLRLPRSSRRRRQAPASPQGDRDQVVILPIFLWPTMAGAGTIAVVGGRGNDLLFSEDLTMRKIPAPVLALAGLIGLIPALAGAVEIKNVRSVYGGFAGATRPDSKFLPGDVLFLEYELRGLTIGKETGIVSYYSELEFYKDGDTKP